MATFAEILTQRFGIPTEKAKHVSTVFVNNAPDSMKDVPLQGIFDSFSDVVAAEPEQAGRLLLVAASQTFFLDAGPDDADVLSAASRSVLSGDQTSLAALEGFRQTPTFEYFQGTFGQRLTELPTVGEVFARRPDLDTNMWITAVYGMCLAVTGTGDESTG